jgi:hypothetical protein
MISDVSDSQSTPRPQTVVVPDELRPRWWSRPSPWLWGLVVLLVIVGIAVTQVPRLSTRSPAGRSTLSPAKPAVLPALSGPAYTQAMISGRNFIGADLRGARFIRLDLRGKDFQGADAAGAMYADSLLNGANFSHADLRGADLRDACLRGADFAGAQLAGADFTGADVTGATVYSTATSQTIGWASIPASQVCPAG